MATQTILAASEKTLREVQEYDVASLAREDLSTTFNFSAAVAPAARLIDLFRRISLQALPDFPDANLQAISQHAQAVLDIFQRIKAFTFEATSNPQLTRQEYTQQVTSMYDSVWANLFSYIGYSAARTSDLKKMEIDARTMMEAIRVDAKTHTDKLAEYEDSGKALLDEVRKVAAEQGVSQQAHHFNTEAANHRAEAESWRIKTRNVAIGLGIYASLTVFSGLIPEFKDITPTQSAQVIAGKVLLFAVIAYFLLLSARNFLSHKHNEIVNRHRQNALLTFNALAQAASKSETRDIILSHASACIFAPQETGYAKGTTAGETSLPQALLGLVAKSETR